MRRRLEQISKLSWPDDLDKEVKELTKLIGRYKFKEAETIVESIISKLKSKRTLRERNQSWYLPIV